ncbi:ABC transporter ATP-binding protein [Micromonospora fiedleri]|uniref:ABC transporter ATP-binding protein n=1 Tax=Micromonospora fiedleri TaxID=1157498 RepID=A0ABS1UQQ1_9ACTN|nr:MULTISPECIES: ABC transporter ATP-binding protein [Micromonospora]MBL6277240.1 ABC transporter ATP-binding protein [Micromonospora fiedleri]WSK43094.1 ABC transporter ATP-binding protein [Micromonospora maris]
MTAMLSLSDVTLIHGDGEDTVTALDKVNLEVEAGELVAIVGPSGAGKSSLLAVCGALISPTSGTIRLNDLDLSVQSPRRLTAIRRERIGFVFQSGNLIPSLTSLDQVRLPLTFGKVANPRDPRELLAEVGMSHKADRRPHQLSGGERQRVGIARALVTRPQVLLVDEPTAALDRQRSQDVVALLAREAHEHGVATVMVTHDHEVLHHCDRVLEMIDGRLLPAESNAAV